jgi:hypothetical protein
MNHPKDGHPIHNKMDKEGCSLALETKQVKVTDRVIGKINGDSIELYEGNRQIGYLSLSQVSHLMQLKDGYDQQNGQIYKEITVTVEPDQKYVDCDGEAGWC